uniref:Selenoprotein W, 2b n=1 Tax=Oncorhynchus tshawytscha TaxID=74940 RepID=A0AAZ3Q2K1_ONCTS
MEILQLPYLLTLWLSLYVVCFYAVLIIHRHFGFLSLFQWPMRVLGPRYKKLQQAVAVEFPGCDAVVSAGSFELEINGELVFSKLETGGFPMEKDVRDALQNTYAGKQVEKWTRNRPPCVIL